MGSSAIEQLLTGKRKRWIAIVWGLTATAVMVLPYVDRSLQQYREFGVLRAEQSSKAELPARARALSDRVDALTVEMRALEAALVPSAALSTLRQDVTAMARDSKCRLRSIRPGPVLNRPLAEMNGKTAPSSRRPSKQAQWMVESRASSVSIQGTYANLMNFLTALSDDERVLRPASIQIQPPPGPDDDLTLDVSIETFDLIHGLPS